MDSQRRSIQNTRGFRHVLVLFFLLNTQSVVFGITVEKDLQLTATEKQLLVKFREKVSPLLYRDFMKNSLYLVRWLRGESSISSIAAQHFDLDSAEGMLRKSLKWRKERKIDTIMLEDWSDMKSDFHTTTDTHDKEGRPILVIDSGDWDVRSGMLRGQGPRLLRYAEYLLENITLQIFEQQRKGLNVTQWSVLGSANGFNVVSHACPICLPFWIQFVQTVESNFPGWMDKVIVIDTPASISVFFQAVRPFLSPYSKNSLRIFGPNKNRWMKYLDEYIAKDQRTSQYGGNRSMGPLYKYN